MLSPILSLFLSPKKVVYFQWVTVLGDKVTGYKVFAHRREYIKPMRRHMYLHSQPIQNAVTPSRRHRETVSA